MINLPIVQQDGTIFHLKVEDTVSNQRFLRYLQKVQGLEQE